MNRTAIQRNVSFVGILLGLVTLVFSATASAHVTVKPAEVVTAGFQTFTVNVPNEKTIPTTSVKVAIPSNVAHVSPTQKQGWEVTTEKEGTGENATVKSITWSGGAIGEGLRDEFSFSAQVPEKPTELRWKAYQTYEDGTVVSWDKASEGGHGEAGGNSGPFSVTHVVSETVDTAAIKKADQAAADARTAANRSLYIAIAALVLGLVGVGLATRKK